MKWMHRISALTLAVLLGACGGAKPAGEPGHEDESQAEAGGHEEEGHEEAMDRTTIAAKVAQDAGIRVAPAAAGVIALSLAVPVATSLADAAATSSERSPRIRATDSRPSTSW